MMLEELEKAEQRARGTLEGERLKGYLEAIARARELSQMILEDY
jgi:hypothetical protein